MYTEVISKNCIFFSIKLAKEYESVPYIFVLLNGLERERNSDLKIKDLIYLTRIFLILYLFYFWFWNICITEFEISSEFEYLSLNLVVRLEL